jgi:hypothetical protein
MLPNLRVADDIYAGYIELICLADIVRGPCQSEKTRDLARALFLREARRVKYMIASGGAAADIYDVIRMKINSIADEVLGAA